MPEGGRSTPDLDYFVKVTTLAPPPPPEPQEARSRRPGMWTGILVALCLLGAGIFMFTVGPLGAPDPGSKEDLVAHFENLNLPGSMHQDWELFNLDSTIGPELNRRYSIDGSIPSARTEAVAELEELGLDPYWSDRFPTLITGHQKDYTYFLIFHEPPWAAPYDNVLPHSVEAEVIVFYTRDFDKEIDEFEAEYGS
jgi:hypothetical protein